MRYVILWNNGYWKIKDLHTYKDCERFDTYKEAEQALNA